ncbi:MAG: hypothetical protein FJW98_01050 [Actinobacteria bacterium]|nr:hypothetical protein [Actinomycetota bacterium]
MESLAMAAAIIMLTIMVLGVVSLIVALKSPRRRWVKLVASVFSSCAVLAGGWMFLLEVGIGARLIGAAVAATGLWALTRMWLGRL